MCQRKVRLVRRSGREVAWSVVAGCAGGRWLQTAGQRLWGMAWQLDIVWVLHVEDWALWLGRMSREVVQGQEARWESVERRGERLGGRGGPAVGKLRRIPLG